MKRFRKGQRVKFWEGPWGRGWVTGKVADVFGNMVTVQYQSESGGWRDIDLHATKVYSARSGKRKNPMTKKQRSARARKAGAVRRKANAAKNMLIAMNPATKAKAVRIKRLKGGGVSITPVKVHR